MRKKLKKDCFEYNKKQKHSKFGFKIGSHNIKRQHFVCGVGWMDGWMDGWVGGWVDG